MKLLIVNCCISQRGASSRTGKLLSAYVEEFCRRHPEAELETVTPETLLALKPFLRKERQEKIDRALHAARLASLASLALKNRGRGPGAKETP